MRQCDVATQLWFFINDVTFVFLFLQEIASPRRKAVVLAAVDPAYPVANEAISSSGEFLSQKSLNIFCPELFCEEKERKNNSVK